jgi:hypothetical protein
MLNRLLRRLAGPPPEEVRELARAVKKLSDAQRDQAQAALTRLSQLSDLIAQRASSKDANEILHAVRATTALVSRALPAPGGEDDSEARLNEELDAVAKGSRPIVVGPWTGEVGFELLYWIPFVEWFRTRWRVAPERLVIVTRGGAAAWYGMPGARACDIFSLMSPREFREQTGLHAHKQHNVSPLDQTVLSGATERLALGKPATLHPRLMYRLFNPYWKDEAGYGLLERFTIHRALGAIEDPALEGLPTDYAAVRFYFSDSFPDTADNRARARQMVEAIAERMPVVLLNPGVHLDDHVDAAPAASGRIVSIAGGLPPERNLAAQTAVLGRAKAFIGTYGGFSYLAPLCGVPAIGFYSDRTFKLHHLTAAQRVFEQLGGPTLTTIDVKDSDVVRLATS